MWSTFTVAIPGSILWSETKLKFLLVGSPDEWAACQPGATFTALMCVWHAVLQMLLCMMHRPPHWKAQHHPKCGLFLWGLSQEHLSLIVLFSLQWHKCLLESLHLWSSDKIAKIWSDLFWKQEMICYNKECKPVCSKQKLVSVRPIFDSNLVV